MLNLRRGLCPIFQQRDIKVSKIKYMAKLYSLGESSLLLDLSCPNKDKCLCQRKKGKTQKKLIKIKL